MRNLVMGVVSNDTERAQQLVCLLNALNPKGFTENPADADFLFCIASEQGQWPETPATTLPIIAVGEVAPTELTTCLASITWPVTFDALNSAVHAVMAYRRQQAFSRGDDYASFTEIVGMSANVLAVREQISKVAGSDATVLITGESGTGKEVVARSLHTHSKRCNGPFVPVNCGAIPADLLESELFGHEKGAFTGALNAKPGRFELAAGGTLFLDEIGDMPLPMQVKVLRTLQDRQFERIGGTAAYNADVRIVAATHRNLEEMISEGSFREDLYYRLNVFPIELAPLRERIEDLPLLIQAMCTAIAGEQALKVRLTVDAQQSLENYGWPGNIRELRNLLERLAIQFPDEMVASSDLPARYTETERSTPAAVEVRSHGNLGIETTGLALLPVNGLNLKEYLADLERSLIEQALEDTNSVVARAADRLHIRRTTLVEKMRKYGIERV